MSFTFSDKLIEHLKKTAEDNNTSYSEYETGERDVNASLTLFVKIGKREELNCKECDSIYYKPPVFNEHEHAIREFARLIGALK